MVKCSDQFDTIFLISYIFSIIDSKSMQKSLKRNHYRDSDSMRIEFSAVSHLAPSISRNVIHLTKSISRFTTANHINFIADVCNSMIFLLVSHLSFPSGNTSGEVNMNALKFSTNQVDFFLWGLNNLTLRKIAYELAVRHFLQIILQAQIFPLKVRLWKYLNNGEIPLFLYSFYSFSREDANRSSDSSWDKPEVNALA